MLRGIKFSGRFTLLALSLSILFLFYAFNHFHINNNISSNITLTKLNQHPNDELLIDLKLLQQIITLNEKAFLFNADNYSSLDDNNLVIVVQVHNRFNYLKYLIDSLSKVKGVENVLIVFSHDFYSTKLNNLIQNIHFCKVVQIFYPFSQQIWTNTFPGASIWDCKKNFSKEKAKKIRCLNADHPDSYGHYRESNVTQTKHHWFWKLNFVFEHLEHTKQHNGDFIFVEEDHYFSPDFLHIWRLMKQIKEHKSSSNNVDILTMGHYEKVKNFRLNSNKVQISQWFSSKHNMGFSINRILWTQIKLCSQQFCTFDDYNWDWSLMQVINKCLKQKLKTLVITVPRLYHIGACGIHHKGKNCNVTQIVNEIESQLILNKQWLFPSELIQFNKKSTQSIIFRKNGGWSDPRDHELCQQYQFDFNEIIKINSNFAKVTNKLKSKVS